MWVELKGMLINLDRVQRISQPRSREICFTFYDSFNDWVSYIHHCETQEECQQILQKLSELLSAYKID